MLNIPDSCEHDNEPLDPIKGGGLLDWVIISFPRTLLHGVTPKEYKEHCRDLIFKR
jgi:hypothetical protein